MDEIADWKICIQIWAPTSTGYVWSSDSVSLTLHCLIYKLGTLFSGCEDKGDILCDVIIIVFVLVTYCCVTNYSWLLNNTGLNCVSPLIHGFFFPH